MKIPALFTIALLLTLPIFQVVEATNTDTATVIETVRIEADQQISANQTYNLIDEPLKNFESWEPFTTNNTDIKGIWSGSQFPEIMIGLGEAVSNSSYVTVSGIINLKQEHVMSGVSELWLRSPFNITRNESVTRVVIYRIDNPNIANLSSIDAPISICNPQLVFANYFRGQNYDRRIYDYREYLRIAFPLLPDTSYYVTFNRTGDWNDRIWVAYDDIGNDEIYHMRTRTYGTAGVVKEWTIDPGISLIATEGIGTGISGVNLTRDASIGWDLVFNTTVDTVTDVIDFYMPFVVKNGSTYDILVKAHAINPVTKAIDYIKVVTGSSLAYGFYSILWSSLPATYSQIELFINITSTDESDISYFVKSERNNSLSFPSVYNMDNHYSMGWEPVHFIRRVNASYAPYITVTKSATRTEAPGFRDMVYKAFVFRSRISIARADAAIGGLDFVISSTGAIDPGSLKDAWDASKNTALDIANGALPLVASFASDPVGQIENVLRATFAFIEDVIEFVVYVIEQAASVFFEALVFFVPMLLFIVMVMITWNLKTVSALTITRRFAKLEAHFEKRGKWGIKY